MDTLTFTNPWDGVDRKQHRQVWGSLLVLWLTGPLMFGLLAWGVSLGFMMQDSAESIMRIGLIVAVACMAASLVIYQPLSDVTDKVSASANTKMWANVNEGLERKYGPGLAVPVDAEPTVIGPPDGSTGFWAWVEERTFGKNVKVLWTPEGGEPQRKMLAVMPRTFEPTLNELPQRTPKKKL